MLGVCGIKPIIMIRPINRCLNAQLLNICQQAVQLDELNRKLKEHLFSPLGDHCLVGSFNKGCLLITTTNSSWATELRYAVPDLRDKLRKEGLYQLTSIKIAVIDQVDQMITDKQANQMELSSSARDNIRTASELCTYPPLKTALSHLARDKDE
ncbi:hypothetical protein Ldro_1501 [Legionella drozanskii LLAP-1]|uniref:DUF721 domain-containing protein n=2 Tax=Legionellaceae TaxID=444 RepID=A0A0W0SWZ5_9GAMM|nr:hypothetical protein Ldro_1501 [Legionella drozanskii LLAP-1]